MTNTRDRGDEGHERRSLAPHRGGAVLTLGILGLCVCFICGIFAWVMGNSDLRAMREGRMDRAGEGSTSAGRICGMVSVILVIVGITIYVVFFGVVLTNPEIFKNATKP